MSFYAEPVIGYRGWIVNPGIYRITSKIVGAVDNIRTVWPTDRPLKAECMETRFRQQEPYALGHDDRNVPSKGCTCGIYAFHTVKECLDHNTPSHRMLIGAAMFWGEIEVHTWGFKAEFARPVAFCDLNKFQNFKKGIPELGWPALLERIREAYRLPIFDDLEELEIYANEFGQPLGLDYLTDEEDE